MTDFNRWDELIQLVKLRGRDIITGELEYWDGKKQKEPIFSEYVTIPMSDYHIANLLDALMDADDTGDWLGEILTMLQVALKKAGVREVTSNKGNTFNADNSFDIYRRK